MTQSISDKYQLTIKAKINEVQSQHPAKYVAETVELTGFSVVLSYIVSKKGCPKQESLFITLFDTVDPVEFASTQTAAAIDPYHRA